MRRLPAALIVLLASALLTAAATAFVGISARARDEARFENAVQATRDRIEARLEAYIALLRGGAGLFAASEAVDVREFRAYVARLDVDRRYPGVQGIGFSRRLAPGEGPEVEARMRAEGLPEFRLWPATPRQEVHAIVYLEPLDRRNREALGYDMSTEPTRWQAMARARDTGQPALSGRVTLVQEIDVRKQAGFLLYVPVYRGGGTPDSMEARRAALLGFVYSPFRADDLFTGIFGTEREPRVSFQVYDGEQVTPAQLLHDSRTDPAEASSVPAFSTRTTLQVAGRTWTLAFQSRPAFEWASRRYLPPAIGLVGALISLVLFSVTRAQARARRTAELSAEELGRSLVERQRAEDRLRLSAARLRLLSEASHVLAEELEASEILLQRVARLAVASLASACLMDVREEDGSLRRVAGAHRDPEGDARVRRLPSRTPAPQEGAPLAEVLQTGRSLLLTDLGPEAGAHVAKEEVHAAWMQEMDVRSVLVVAMRARGRVLGLLAMGSDRRLDAEDLAMAEELGYRAAAALDNARLYREAQEAVRLRDEFLSIAGHELRTPLTSLSLKLGSLSRVAGARGEQGPLAQRVARDVEVAQRQVRRLTLLIEQLLDVSRLAQQRLTLRREEVDLAAVVREAVGVLGPEASRAGCVVEVEAEEGVVGRWDGQRLEQVVTNLLSNALKYGAGRPVRVSVTRVGSGARLAVRDEGIGIDAAALARIFERFERAVSERHYGGLGLGLYITRQIVEAHGGRIWAESTPGQGSTFFVELPREEPRPSEP